MPSFAAFGDAVRGVAKGINPAEVKLVSGSTDALKGLKGASGIGADALKGAGGLGDAKGLLKSADNVGGAAQVAKGADNVGGAAQVAKGADNVGDAGKAAKGADNVGDAGKAAKGADEVGDAAKAEKNAPPLKNKADAEKSMAQWVKDNPGKAIAAAAGATAIALAADSYMATNGANVGITKIEAGKDGGVFGVGATDIAKITYTPALAILKVDFLTLSGTDCSPSIDGTDVAVYKVPSKTEVWIKVSSALKTGGTKGQITLKTTPTARLGEAVGAGVGAAGGAVKEAGGGVLDGLGLGLPEGTGMWLLVGCIALIIIIIMFKFVF